MCKEVGRFRSSDADPGAQHVALDGRRILAVMTPGISCRQLGAQRLYTQSAQSWLIGVILPRLAPSSITVVDLVAGRFPQGEVPYSPRIHLRRELPKSK